MIELYNKSQIDNQAAVTGDRIKTRTSAPHILNEIAGAANANVITDAERASIATIEPSHFKGTFASVADIPTAGAREGDYAVLAVAGGDDTQAIWDVDAGAWVDTGSAVTGETPATIKTKYESNPNTNAFTDADMAKLDGITEASDITSFTAALDGALA